MNKNRLRQDIKQGLIAFGDRFEAKRFQNLTTPLNPKENRWFKDFNCPVG